MISKGSYALRCATLVILLGAGGQVMSQATHTPTTTSTSDLTNGSSDTVEEIIVTAQKREENVQKVPIAIEAFSANGLATLQINNTADLANFVPGLNITRANVASVPFLRGVGNFTATPGNEAAVATYIDDVYYASPAASTFGFANLDRIEVLKGPQGTLFGRNAAGGVINILTKDPSSTPSADASIGYGNYNTSTASFYGTSGLAQNLAGDISLYGENQSDGWGHNLYTGRPTYLSYEVSARTKLVYTPTDDWYVRFIADMDSVRNDESSTLNIIPGTKNILGIGTATGFYNTAENFSGVGEQRQFGFSLKVQHEMNWASITSISAYRDSAGFGNQDTDASSVNYSSAAFKPKQTTSTQEFQLASLAASDIKWIAGLYLFFDDAGNDPISQFGTPYGTLPLDEQFVFGNQVTQSYAVYSQATFPVRSDTRLTVGARYTIDYRQVHGNFFDANGVNFDNVNQSDDWSKPTYRVSLDHDFSPTVLGYVSFNTGFKSGNYNVTSPAAAPVAPETISAYEVGEKSDLFNGTLRLNASAFYYRFTNLQVQESLAAGTIQLNAASADYKGIDVDATAVVTSRLSFTASLEVLDPRYNNFPAAVYNFPCITPTVSHACAGSINGGGYYTAPGNAAGNLIPYAERGTATLSANYKIPSAEGNFIIEADAAYHNGFYFDVQNTLLQPQYTLVNASLQWSPLTTPLDVKLWGKNLRNVEYYSQQQVNATVADYSAAPPRTYGITFTYHWR
jgi:iron complex outermembrane receptor protein